MNALSEKELEEQFTCMILRLDNLKELNETLGRTAGDTLLRDFGEMVKTLSRNYGFMDFNNGGMFMGLFEQCPATKADLFLDMPEKSVEEYNNKQIELQIRYTAAYSNSTDEKTYDIRKLLRSTFGKLNEAKLFVFTLCKRE